MSGLPEVQRPNGKFYRPRKLMVYAVTDSDDSLSGVVVFGTHRLTSQVQDLADQYAVWQCGYGYAARGAVPVWWRDGFCNGHRVWMNDPVRGRAGILFAEILERTP